MGSANESANAERAGAASGSEGAEVEAPPTTSPAPAPEPPKVTTPPVQPSNAGDRRRSGDDLRGAGDGALARRGHPGHGDCDRRSTRAKAHQRRDANGTAVTERHVEERPHETRPSPPTTPTSRWTRRPSQAPLALLRPRPVAGPPHHPANLTRSADVSCSRASRARCCSPGPRHRTPPVLRRPIRVRASLRSVADYEAAFAGLGRSSERAGPPPTGTCRSRFPTVAPRG